MKQRRIAVIGGGAAGMAAAITAAGKGADITIYEKNDRVGKKLLATGNGKCNLTNLDFSVDKYNSETPELLKPYFDQCTVSDTLKFFHELGLLTKEKNGYVYPSCEQASVVLDILRLALERNRVKKHENFLVNEIQSLNGRFRLHNESNNEYSGEYDAVIIACGSPAGQKKKDKYYGQELAEKLGIKFYAMLPALVQLYCKEKFFNTLAGVRCQAKVSVWILDDKEYSESGELQLTEYGISGIPVFQLSRHVSMALQHKKELRAAVDFMPSYPRQEWMDLFRERIEKKWQYAEELFLGTVNKKIYSAILKENGIKLTDTKKEVSSKKLLDAAMQIKHFSVTITDTKPFENAQVCAGGIPLTQVNEHLETKKRKNIYVAGEILDADGRCGGYNLQWAWTTGIIAGTYAARGTDNA